MTDRKANKRKLEKSGFRHVAGWVHEEDVPTCEKVIDRARDKVNALVSKAKEDE